MEINLDDKYYQKYIEYKQKYLLLKQLKNNDELDLEGGMFGLWGSKKTEKTPSSETTDGDYLVFTIDTIDKSSYIYLIDQNSTKSIDMNDFLLKHKDKAYLLNKKGTRLTGSIITKDKNTKIDTVISTMRKKLFIDKDIPLDEKKHIYTENQQLNEVIKKYDTYYREVDKILRTDTNNEVINAAILKFRTEFLNNSEIMKTNMITYHKNLKTTFSNILSMSEFSKYKSITIDYDNPFDNSNGDKFLNNLNTKIKSETGSDSNLNMIIKIYPIRPADTEYNFTKRGTTSISFTQKYKDIKLHEAGGTPQSSSTTTTTVVTTSEEAPQ
jgi:hypothetical protein